MSKELALKQEQPSVALLLQGMIERGVTSDNVAALEQLVGLHERMEKRSAEKEFASAFVALQSEMPSVQASKMVPNKDGSVRYYYAPYEEVMKQVQPMLTKHCFTVTFDTKIIEGGRIVSICTLMHTGGHSRSNEFAVRIGHGPPSASEAQADGAAKSYAKRGALCDCLNIVTAGLDDDAREEGGFITAEQAADLMRRVSDTKADLKKFLAFANAPAFDMIRESNFAELDEVLRKREAPKRAPEERDEDGNFKFGPASK